jgi:hypothetical protein
LFENEQTLCFSNMIPRQHSILTCVSLFYWRDKSKQNVKCKNMTEQCHQSVTKQPSSCECVFKWRRSGTFLCDLV